MAEQTRPNVTGKGPALVNEMLDIFKQIEENLGNLTDNAAEKVKSVLSEKGETLGGVIRMAYLKTVKAGETAYDCKQMALELKESIESGSEDNAMQILDKLGSDLDGFIRRIKTFVVRMT